MVSSVANRHQRRQKPNPYGHRIVKIHPHRPPTKYPHRKQPCDLNSRGKIPRRYHRRRSKILQTSGADAKEGKAETNNALFLLNAHFLVLNCFFYNNFCIYEYHVTSVIWSSLSCQDGASTYEIIIKLVMFHKFVK